jgi:hypothetical protein
LTETPTGPQLEEHDAPLDQVIQHEQIREVIGELSATDL